MKRIATVLLLTGFCSLAPGQTPIQITAACPGSLAASSNYQTSVTVNIIGTGFTKTTQIRSSHTVSSTYINPTQMQVTLLGSELATPGTIGLTAFDNRATLAITTTALSSGTMNVPYVASVSATGGETPYTWSATGLPAGLQINNASGIISGTPTAVGTSTAIVTVQDAGNPSQTASASLPIMINPTLAISRTTLPSWDANAPNYSATVAATGGAAPYTWSAAGLPAGLSMNPATGTISGTPGQLLTGFAIVIVTVVDSSQPQQFAQAALPITINGPLLVPSTTLTLNSNNNYMTNVMSTGGTQPYTWSATGLGPSSGFTLSPNGTLSETGTLYAVDVIVTSGTGAGSGAQPPTVTVTDAAKQTAVATLCIACDALQVRTAQPKFTVTSNTFNLNILAPATLTTLMPAQTTQSAPLALAIAGGPFIAPAQGCPSGTPATTLIWNGIQSNATLTVAPNSLLALIPNSLVTPGTVTVAVQDPFGVALSNSLPLIINPIPSITTKSTLPSGIAGKPYTTPIASSGGTQPLVWSILPTGTGLSIDANGVISGTLPASGPVSVQVMLRDAVSVVATPVTFSIPVIPIPSVSLNVQTNPVVVLGQQNSVTVALSQIPQGTVTGSLSVQFQSDPAVAANPNTRDPAVQLAATQFTIASPATTIQVLLQPGLTAGTLTVTASNIQLNGVDVTPTVLPAATLTIPPAPPTVQSACLVRQPSAGLGVATFNIAVTGFSNTRELTQARFLLTGNQLGTNEVDFNNANSLFGPYYTANFLAFNYRQTLQVSGNPDDVGGVSVVLVNKEGSSPAFPAAASCP